MKSWVIIDCDSFIVAVAIEFRTNGALGEHDCLSDSIGILSFLFFSLFDAQTCDLFTNLIIEFIIKLYSVIGWIATPVEYDKKYLRFSAKQLLRSLIQIEQKHSNPAFFEFDYIIGNEENVLYGFDGSIIKCIKLLMCALCSVSVIANFTLVTHRFWSHVHIRGLKTWNSMSRVHR